MLFVAGSLMYLLVSIHDLKEVLSCPGFESLPFTARWKELGDFWSATTYTIGTLMYIIGSVLFLPSIDKVAAGAWNFILGSVLFLIGAVINSAQIFDARSIRESLLSNFTAVTFVIGSTTFLTASVPYLWSIESDVDENLLFKYLALQYILGSVCFLVGGIINYQRTWELHTHWVKESQRHLDVGSNFVAAEDLINDITVLCWILLKLLYKHLTFFSC